MPWAFFPGCQLEHQAPDYGVAARRVAKELGVGLTELEFGCCGYPNRDFNFEAYILSAARNLALAEAAGLDLLTPCKCCYGSLRLAAYWLGERSDLAEWVNEQLAEAGLTYTGRAEVVHLNQVLAAELEKDQVKERLVRNLDGLKAAVLQGCHAIRPSKITGYNNGSDSLDDGLVAALGGESLDWAGRLDCCGAHLKERQPAQSQAFIDARLEESQAAGAETLVVGCTHSHLQAQEAWARLDTDEVDGFKGPILTAQLVGLALGLDPADIGLDPESALAKQVTTPPAEPEPEPEAKAEDAA